jgi:hypothetical protein
MERGTLMSPLSLGTMPMLIIVARTVLVNHGTFAEMSFGSASKQMLLSRESRLADEKSQR